MVGVFQLRANRVECRTQLDGVELELFKGDFTDDESEDHDNTESESEASE